VPATFNVLVSFMAAGFNIFQICLKKNINIQYNFLKKNYIYKFYYHLYFLISKFLIFKNLFTSYYKKTITYSFRLNKKKTVESPNKKRKCKEHKAITLKEQKHKDFLIKRQKFIKKIEALREKYIDDRENGYKKLTGKRKRKVKIQLFSEKLSSLTKMYMAYRINIRKYL
jgi:hypothetical protein